MSYSNEIDPIYVRDRITLFNESPATVADKIARGIPEPGRKEDILRRVNLMVAQNNWRYVPLGESIQDRIRKYRLGMVDIDPKFVEAATVDLLELALGDGEGPGDLKTARNLVRDLGSLKPVDAYVTSSKVEVSVRNALEQLSLEELERLRVEAVEAVESCKALPQKI